MTDDPAPGERDRLAELFWTVARRLRHTSVETLAPWEITPGQARALAVLLRHGPMRLSELSEHLHIVPRSGTEVVDALADAGLVERRRDPGDRRAVLVVLTEAGERTGDAIRTARAAEAEAFFGVLGDDDRRALAALLERLLAG